MCNYDLNTLEQMTCTTLNETMEICHISTKPLLKKHSSHGNTQSGKKHTHKLNSAIESKI